MSPGSTPQAAAAHTRHERMRVPDSLRTNGQQGMAGGRDLIWLPWPQTSTQAESAQGTSGITDQTKATIEGIHAMYTYMCTYTCTDTDMWGGYGGICTSFSLVMTKVEVLPYPPIVLNGWMDCKTPVT